METNKEGKASDLNKDQNLKNPEVSNKLSDYPEGNTDETTESIPGNQTDRPTVAGRSMSEATDPKKLPDI